MNYPLHLDGVESVEGDTLVLWAPDKIVEEAGMLLEPNSRILDLGAGRGTNGTYLAMLGHEVISLEINPDYIENGRRIVRALGSMAVSNTFVEGDMVKLDELEGMRPFDAVIATRSLQLVTKKESYEVLGKIQEITKPGGLNIIRAYIATPAQQKVMSHRAFFEPEELKHIYAASRWAEIKYDYKLLPLTTYYGKPGCQSTAEILAKKPKEYEHQRSQLLREAEYYRRSDPELYQLLTEQANALL